MAEVSKDEELLSQISESVKAISSLPDCRTVSRKMYGNLVRRVKLLSPLFEELKDSGNEAELGDDIVRGLDSLSLALGSSLELLKSVLDGSKIFQALQVDKIAAKFENVTKQIETALTHIPYIELDLTEEVQEQIELLHNQFKRAVTQTESPDLQLAMDLAAAQMEDDPDPLVFKRLSEKLHLRTMSDINRELLAIHEMVISCGGVPEGVSEDYIETMSYLLRMIKECVMIDNPDNDATQIDNNLIKHRSPIIPDDFRCPISLELMKDPVIVSTGQTYERSCIQKWLDAGHKTCPKTQQTLLHSALTPNYVLKSLIALWCESNGVELPKATQSNCRRNRRSSSIHTSTDCDRPAIDALLHKLAHGHPDQHRAAAGELRLLAKRNADNRVCIAEAGAIPLLVELLASPDLRTQEHAVTALLNLSINEANKGIIVNAGAIPDIVDVLKNGSTEARENAAATLFSLSVIDENKVAIGAAGAVPPLINLLCRGTPRGKKDAATAIFNLSIYQGNKVRAVRAGEGTGVFVDRDGAGKHIQAGAKKVLITAPGKGDIPTYVVGVNAGDYSHDEPIISNASCTTNCLAPFVKVLDQKFGIIKGTMTTTHSYTGDQRLLDASHRDLRRARAAALNIVPTSTGAAKAVALVLPQLKGKLNGIALRVPTPNVSVVDLVVQVEKKTFAEEVNAAFREAADNELNGILSVCDEPLVSVDFRCSDVSSTVDSSLTMVMGDDMVKVIAWYDNEWGYSQRVVDLADIVANNWK